jgi:6-phosphogluconate dehydrogenase
MEYAEMQLLAEVFALLSLHRNYDEIASLLAEWNQGDLSSYLLGITVDILQKKEENAYLLDLILDKAGNKGTGSWSSKAAFDLGVASTMMSSAVFARYMSAFKEKRIQLSERLSKNGQTKMKLDVSALKNAYRFARVINHHQGFDLMQQASDTYNWDLKVCQIARIWTEGCIIKSKLMAASIGILRDSGELLEDKNIFYALTSSENDVVSVVQNGLENRVSIPCFYAAYDYWIAMTTRNLPANLIQAQRDFFGAHTYQRKDKEPGDFFHTNWTSSK